VSTDIFDAFTFNKLPKDILDKVMAELPMLDVKDIADAVVYVLSTPPNVLITELTVRSMNEVL
jgi:NADP-dependent 3-hydroxy acid dehydrogenase YdfG